MFRTGSVFAFLTFQYSFTVVFVKLKIAASILICIEHFFTVNTNYDDIGAKVISLVRSFTIKKII